MHRARDEVKALPATPTRRWVPRVWWIVLALSLIAAGCSSGDDAESGSPTTTIIERASDPSGSVAELVAFVADDAAVMGRADDAYRSIVGPPETNLRTERAVEGRLAECDVVLTSLTELADDAPGDVGDPAIDEPLSRYLDAWRTKLGAYETSCAAMSQDRDQLQAAVDAEVDKTGFFGETRFLQLEIPLFESREALLGPCTELQAAIQDIDGALLPCFDADEADRGTDSLAVDVAAGPTGTLNDLVPVGPGTYRFDWFQIPFELIVDESYDIASTEKGFVFINTAATNFPVIEVAVVDRLVDPATPEPTSGGELDATIPVPLDLGAWLDGLPVIVTSQAVDVGGRPAGYYTIVLDPGSGLQAVALFEGAQPEWGAFTIFPDATLHLWHVDDPNGTLFIFELDEFGSGSLGGQGFIEAISLLSA